MYGRAAISTRELQWGKEMNQKTDIRRDLRVAGFGTLPWHNLAIGYEIARSCKKAQAPAQYGGQHEALFLFLVPGGCFFSPEGWTASKTTAHD
jgi:hypothetical protein